MLLAVSAIVVSGLIWSRMILWDSSLDIAVLPGVFVPPLVFQGFALLWALIFAIYSLFSCAVIRKVHNGTQSALFIGVIAFLILCACIARVTVLSMIVAGLYVDLTIQVCRISFCAWFQN